MRNKNIIIEIQSAIGFTSHEIRLHPELLKPKSIGKCTSWTLRICRGGLSQGYWFSDQICSKNSNQWCSLAYHFSDQQRLFWPIQRKIENNLIHPHFTQTWAIKTPLKHHFMTGLSKGIQAAFQLNEKDPKYHQQLVVKELHCESELQMC